MTRTVYLVMGSCGEFDCYEEWPVKVFTREDDALAFLKKATDRASEVVKAGAGLDWTEKMAVYQKNELDPHMQTYRDEVPEYGYTEIELEESHGTTH